MIVKFLNEKKEDWDVYIDCHVFAYNTAKHASSLYSPFEVIFGRKAVLPIERHLMTKEKHCWMTMRIMTLSKTV